MIDNEKWLQVKGDPAIRQLVFQQSRVESIFDRRIDGLNEIINELMCNRGVYSVRIHYSSNQLTCWTLENPYSYDVHVGEGVFDPDFVEEFGISKSNFPTKIPSDAVMPILEELKGFRFLDDTIYLRNASINRVNGMISLTFSCDGSHYISYEEFYSTSIILKE